MKMELATLEEVCEPVEDAAFLAQCGSCTGRCCKLVRLTYKSNRRIYKNSPYLKGLKELGFVRRDDGWFTCNHYHPDNAPEGCDIYDNRPYWCQRYTCDGNLYEKVGE